MFTKILVSTTGILVAAIALSGCASHKKISLDPSPTPATPLPMLQTAAPDAASDFKLGTSSNTVEKMALQLSCQSDKGAALVSEPGPIEFYQEQCRDGRMLMARCEMRQCNIE
jgi:hypothetical protein